MTVKKTSDTDPEIIEGVAIETPASVAGRRRSAGRGKARASDATSGTSSAGAAAGKAAPDDTNADGSMKGSPDSETPAKTPARRASLAVMLGAAAALLVFAGIAIQQWMMARQEGHYQAEIEALVAQIDTTNDMLARAQAEILVMKTKQDDLASRLAGFENALPEDPAEVLAALSARLDRLAADLESRPAASNTASPRFESDLVLAQAGLGAATAMNAGNLEGGDPAQWMPVLRELASAGLDVGDLSRLEAVLIPPPVPVARLLAEGSGLAAGIGQERSGVSGWWQDTSGMIAGFIRLRRSDDAPSAAGGAAGGAAGAATPMDDFARALRTEGLAAALAASHRITPMPDGLAEWQARAQRRLDLDAALAALMAHMTAHLVSAGAAG